MFVNLTDPAGWPREFDMVIDPSVIRLEADNARLTGPITAKGKIEKHAVWFEVGGGIEVDVAIDCSRCLEPVDRHLSIPFDVRFVYAGSTEPREREVDPSDLNLSEIEGERIDLMGVIREQILLDLPEQVFCQENCRGLCPKCGSNRNLIDCKCDQDELDPRWEALKKLK